MRVNTVLATILMTGAAFGQSGPGGAKFVAADVHVTPMEELPFSFQNLAPGNRVILRSQTLTHLIAMAFGVDDDKVSGGPKWLDADHFDVIARPPTTTAARTELQEMLRTLLAERFQLMARLEDKQFSAYVWTPAKNGLHLKPSKNATSGGCEIGNSDGFLVRNCTGMTVQELGRQVHGFANGYFNFDVVDRTGATGRYDFMLKWSGKGMLERTSDAISLYDVLEKQYGIKTSQDTATLTAVVVESANETPAPNPGDTAALLPPMPTEFEVSQIRINKDPNAKEYFRSVGGRIDALAVPMTEMIKFAYGVENDNLLVGAPSWADHELYDVVAKTDPTVDFVGMQPMLQKLLEERFHLKVHREDRPVEVYALTVGKNGSKLAPGDAAARSDCRRSVNVALTLACQNTTMAEFAALMRRYAPGYIDLPVADLTGLNGSFNFSVSWNDRAMTDPGRGRSGDGADDVGGGITFFKGVEKIGLQLTKEKRPMPAVVVDKLDRAPAAN
jgi:uncharacterized protein (TIGR03435 family)